MLHPVVIHSASSEPDHYAVTVSLHSCSPDMRGNADAAGSFSGHFCCALALTLNKLSFPCCSVSTGWCVTPSVPSEACDSICLAVFQPRCDGGTRFWIVSDGHCFQHQKERFCMFVCDRARRCVGRRCFVRQVLFSPAAVWQMVNNFQPRDCMCSALFLFKSETQLYPSEIFQTSADCLEFWAFYIICLFIYGFFFLCVFLLRWWWFCISEIV